MKKILLILISTAITSLNAQSYKYLGKYIANSTPMYLECPSDILSLQPSSTPHKDALYLEDGPWGLDYLVNYATTTNFNITIPKRAPNENNYEIVRNASASGEVKGNINLFRHLLPGNKSLNVEEYEYLNFNIINNEPVEIVIMPEEDRPWKNRLRYTIPTNSKERFFHISFSDFTDAEGNSVKINNIKTIVFSIIGDYTNYKPFSINVNNLSFTANNVLATDTYTLEATKKMFNYPNPFTNSTTIQLASESKIVKIAVYDVIGRVVDTQQINTNSSLKVLYKAPQLKAGMYKYRLIDDHNKKHSGTFIIK